MNRLVRPETVFFLLVWFAFLIVFRERGFYDPGSLWHTKVGEIILDHGFPWTDPFTYTFEGRTWIPQQWGAEVLMALAHRVGGLDTMLLGFCTVVAGFFTWVFARMRAAGMSPALAGVLTGACLFAGAFHYFVRPHMWTLIFLGYTMATLIDFDRGRASLWRMGSLIPLYIVWTNLHGGVLGGTMSFGLALAGWGLLFLFKQDSPIKNWRTAWLLVAILAACALAPFVNPFGMEMLNTWKRIVGSPVLKAVVNEHKALDLSGAADQVIFGFIVFYTVLFAGTLPTRPRVTWFIPLVWLVLTFKGIRQGPLFAVTAAFAIADFWPHTIWCRLLKKYGDSLIQDPPAVVSWNWRPLLMPVAAVLLVLGLQIGSVPAPIVGRGWARLDSAFSPIPMTDTLKEYARSRGPGARIYNDANFGGYVIYHVPELKIFMDDRFELYGDEWTSEYIDGIWFHPEKFDGWVDRYQLEVALIVTGPDRSPLDGHLSRPNSGWREIGRTSTAVLFRRGQP